MILDTNALSAFLDGDQGVLKPLAFTSIACLPVIVLGEFRFGAMAVRNRESLLARVDECEGAFTVLPVESTTAREYASIRQELKQKGRPIPENDIWIGALARQHRMPILSRDEHFDHVAGVERVAW